NPLDEHIGSAHTLGRLGAPGKANAIKLVHPFRCEIDNNGNTDHVLGDPNQQAILPVCFFHTLDSVISSMRSEITLRISFQPRQVTKGLGGLSILSISPSVSKLS